MIRTETVSLTTIPAVAYRQKLPAGGSGIVILRKDKEQPGIASISKTSGEAIPTGNTSKSLYPDKAFREAIALTEGLPYKKRSAPNHKETNPVKEKEPETELEVIVDGEDYSKIVDAYTDKTGKFSYKLLNKDLIKFINSSSIARKMIAEKKGEDEIRLYAVGSKFRGITKNHKLTDDQVLKISELLDEISPKGIFKEFNDELRKKIKK